MLIKQLYLFFFILIFWIPFNIYGFFLHDNKIVLSFPLGLFLNSFINKIKNPKSRLHFQIVDGTPGEVPHNFW